MISAETIGKMTAEQLSPFFKLISVEQLATAERREEHRRLRRTAQANGTMAEWHKGNEALDKMADMLRDARRAIVLRLKELDDGK